MARCALRMTMPVTAPDECEHPTVNIDPETRKYYCDKCGAQILLTLAVTVNW